MINPHLHILHLEANTSNDLVNKVCITRHQKLMQELDNQIPPIRDYTIIEGFYEPKNTKRAIHRGHQRIVELAKQQGFENCIIAEDDICFSSPRSYEYFLSQIPESYDLFCGLIYSGGMNGNRIISGASGIMTLYSIHSRFYDTFLSIEPNSHVDRECGRISNQHEFFVCEPMCVTQRGGFSINLRQNLFYDAYLEGKEMYR